MFQIRISLIAFLAAAVTIVLLPIETRANDRDVSGCAGDDESWFDDCVERFYDKVRDHSSWSGNYWSDNCKQEYYMREDMGGSNGTYLDESDIHFHNSHCVTSVYDSYYDEYIRAIPFENGNLVPGEARSAWGNGDLEWIGIKCCGLLNDNSDWYWAQAFNHAHLILGFTTSSESSKSFGEKWAKRMFNGDTVTSAWFKATDKTQSSDVEASVLAEVKDNWNDHIHGEGYVSSDPTPNDDKYYWHHWASSPPYRFVNNLSRMSVFEFVRRDVNETYIRNIATSFGMGDVQISEDEDSYEMVFNDYQINDHVLTVYKDTGQYYYHNRNKLWGPDPCGAPFPEEQAERRAREFLAEHGLFPPDAGAFAVEYDELGEFNVTQPDSRKSHLLNCCTVYRREIKATQEQLVTVAGPGAKIKVYIGPDGAIIGAMGNWRRIRKTGEINVMTKQQAWDLFLEHRADVSIAPVETTYDRAEPNFATATQGYYELPAMEYQRELIPCWIFRVNYYEGDNLATTADTYVPAALAYFPPLVRITTPASGEEYDSGQTINCNGDAEADFGTPPYTYFWTSSVDGFLSNEKSFSTNSLSVNCLCSTCGGDNPSPHKIKVTVTDAKGLQSTDMIRLTINGECPDDEELNPADLTKNGVVDLKDLAVFADAYLTRTGEEE